MERKGELDGVVGGSRGVGGGGGGEGGTVVEKKRENIFRIGKKKKNDRSKIAKVRAKTNLKLRLIFKILGESVILD